MNQNETPEQLKQQIAALEQENTALKRKTKYGLNWEDKPETLDNKDVIPLFSKNEELSLPHIDNQPENYLIEGDNYHSLKVLQHTHREKVDVIYIDPPYNTGNTDFVYNDKYVDADDGFRHSKWLSFMDKRLRLARELMKKDGVIFVSIDDNEVAQLKLLMDKIFGEDRFHCVLTWIKKTKPINSGRSRYQAQRNVEYVLVYSKNKKSEFKGYNLKIDGARNYNKQWTDGPCRFIDLEDSDYGRKSRNTMKFPILGITPGVGKRWKIGAEEIDRLIAADKIAIENGKPKKVVYPQDEDAGILKPFWTHFERDIVGSAEAGKNELSDVLGKDHGFDTVKPLALIKEILIHFDNDILTLDFFAGSGTTGHAVMELNAEDGGKRSFILCTNNEVSPEQERNYLANNKDF